MADDITFSHVYGAYIENRPYRYPDQHNWALTTHTFDTGWQIIPNILWRHYATPKDLAELEINYEAYSIKGGKATLFNPIPMTSQMSFQRNSIFTAFNNCMYILGTSDPYYETNWFNFYSDLSAHSPSLFYKEGVRLKASDSASATMTRYLLPRFTYNTPNGRPTFESTFANMVDGGQGCYPSTRIASGVIWDPMNDPDSIMELRPGKNSMSFTWECADCDKDKWFNIDQSAWWYPYAHNNPFGVQMPGQYQVSMEQDPDRLQSQFQFTNTNRDYTMQNLMNCPVLPMSWWWKEMSESIIQNHANADQNKPVQEAFLQYPGTERELCQYPPMQWFCKGVPIFDEQNELILTQYFTSVKIELFLKGKKRRSKIYAPTWGPMNQSIYTSKEIWHKWFGSYIRYRTGGQRRTWLNQQGEGVADPDGDGDQTATPDYGRPRETPYFANINSSSTIPGKTDHSRIHEEPIQEEDRQKAQNLIVTFNRDDDRVVIQRPQVTKRKILRDQPMRSPSPRLDPQEVYQHTHM